MGKEVNMLSDLYTTQALWIALLGFAYLFFNELEDKSIKSKWQRCQRFFNSKKSWMNKWLTDDDGWFIAYRGHWYHFGIKPKFEERFPYSSTLFVFVTDGEHLFQFGKNLTILGMIAVHSPTMALAAFAGMRLAALTKELLNWLD